MEEIWKDILGYEGLYQISNLGRVKSLERKYCKKERILKLVKDRGGYYIVNLRKGKVNTNKVHRLVAQAFIPNPNNLPQVNHKDENPSNNTVDNLEWCTPEYNINYGTRNKRSGEKQINNIKKSKPVLCVETGVIYPSSMEIERNFGFKHSKINDCCNNKKIKDKRGNYYTTKSAYGYHWKYVVVN